VITEMLMDGHKLAWHMDRVRAWDRGERIAPILIDMALTRRCDARCRFCYASLQANEGYTITEQIMDNFLEDCARMGVLAITFGGDGESVLSPAFVPAIQRAASLGIKTALNSNCHMYLPYRQNATLKHLSYVRINFPAGTPKGYYDIMQVSPRFRDRTIQNIQYMVQLKQRDNLSVSLGLQMVLTPDNGEEIIPFVELGRALGVDYSVIKHCADDEKGSLGIDFEKYKPLIPLLKEAEGYTTENYGVQIMWSKLLKPDTIPYQRCYGAPFIIQISGTGLVAACGHKFGPEYIRFHLGNICTERWWDIWRNDRYWEVMRYMASPEFNAQTMCGSLCRNCKINESLDAHKKGFSISQGVPGLEPKHIEFI